MSMVYYDENEVTKRIANVRNILKDTGCDAALIYYDEVNIADAWYLTGWCPQFEKGAVLLPLEGDPILLGGPESEPFAKMSSSITNTRCFSVFMVPDEEYPNSVISTFDDLNRELKEAGIKLRRIGTVGTSYFPHALYVQFQEGFEGAELIDITDEYEVLREVKSEWERENIRKACSFTYDAFKAMEAKVAPGVTEIEIAAEGEYVCRKAGANNFAFQCMVGSGVRANAVVPTATNKEMVEGEWVMLGIAPRYKGYAGVMGETLPVSGVYTQEQKEAMNILRKALRLTKAMLKPGMSGTEIDKPARDLYHEQDWFKYLVCPFAHTIGLMEAERPFYGPNSTDVLAPGMVVSIDISFFGHPTLHGARIETVYVITEDGCEPLSPEMDARFMEDIV